MQVNGVVQVRTPAQSIYNPAQFKQGGSKVTVSYDPELMAKAMLRKAVARAVQAGKPMHHQTQKKLYRRLLAELTAE